MAVNFSQFTSSTTIAGTDQLVGYTNTSPGGERRWSYTDLASSITTTVTNSINTTITQGLSSPTGSFRIRKLADSIAEASYVGAAVTVDEEVIIWGNLTIHQNGHLWGGSARDPKSATILPFLTNATPNNPLDSRYNVLNLKSQGKSVVQLYHTLGPTTVLLSDGTVWGRHYVDASNTYSTGWTTAELAGVAARYPSALYQITQWDWTNPARANKIVNIQFLPVDASDATYGALDDAGDLHLWGYMNPQWGTGIRIPVPVNLTKGNASLQGKVKEFQIAGSNGYRTVQIITTTGEIWGFGYNGYGQLGDNTTVSKTSWVRAQAAATPTSTTIAPITNASFFVKQRNYNYTNLGYVSTAGTPTASQNTLFVSGYEHDTVSVKSAASTSNVYTAGTNGSSPVNDLIAEAVCSGYRANPGVFYRTSSGRVFSAGYHAWGELGRSVASLGPTFDEVDVIHPVTGAKVKFGTGSGLIAKKIITGDLSNANTNAIIATAATSPYGTNHNYVFMAGYRPTTDLNDPAVESCFVFAPLLIRESVEEVLFGGDPTNHQYTFIRCTGGRVYGLGYSSNGTIKNIDGWSITPVPIF